MNNNDRLTRLRYALNLSDAEMVDIFELGGQSMSRKKVDSLLKKAADNPDDVTAANKYELECSDEMLERFLNGFITYKRGPKDGPEPKLELNQQNANNLFLKKVKIALSLTSDDILALLSDAGVEISKSELSAVLRKEGHRNYKPCGDRYIRNFIQGLTLKHRDV